MDRTSRIFAVFYYSVMHFGWFFRVKYIVRRVKGDAMFFVSIPTIKYTTVLNDNCCKVTVEVSTFQSAPF